MRRQLFLLTVLFTVIVGALTVASLSTRASGVERDKASTSTKAWLTASKIQGPFTVTVTPLGPGQSQIDSAVKTVQALPSVRKYLDGALVRQLEFEVLEMARLSTQQSFRVTFYDYTRNRPVVVESVFGNPNSTTVAIGSFQPLPSPEEFDAAVGMLKKDPVFGRLFKSGNVATYRPMPPLASELVGPERTLHVGLLNNASEPPNQIVAVNMISGAVTTYKNNAPPISSANAALCGVPGAGQGTTSRGTAGQFNLTISANGSPVWQMLVIRPAASSGTRASGVELRDVSYLGKSILKRAHVPILNVNYENGACGPYRDWQWQEGMFIANGTDLAPGIRQCTSEPQTMMEARTDTGNFRGVAIYQNPANNEVTIVSELEAGWYRYISRWEFSPTGVIRARFGFDGVDNSCVCNTHNHHAYWRFDFDLGTAGRNRFTEYDTRSFGSPLLTEVKRFRDFIRDRYWLVDNLVTNEQVMIEPGHDDGTADTYARGDAWFLRYRSTELDDGVNTTGPNNTEAKLDNFVNGESINEQDVVMWYSGHYYHVFGGAGDAHVVGPDIIVTRW
jgi:hypothetical protein